MEGIEAESGEDIPCRHLSAVVVAGITARRGAIELTPHLLHQLLGAFRLTREVIEIDRMMTRLVAVGILSDEAAGVAVHLAAGGSKAEVLVEFLQEGFLAAKEVDETFRILRHEPHILPGVALDETRLLVRERIEAFHPIAVFVLRTEETCGGVEEVAVEEAAAVKTLVVIHVPEFLGHGGYTGIIETLLHGDADALVLQGLR